MPTHDDTNRPGKTRKVVDSINTTRKSKPGRSAAPLIVILGAVTFGPGPGLGFWLSVFGALILIALTEGAR